MNFFKNKIFKFFLKLAVSLVFVAWLILKVNWREVLGYALKISWWQIVLYVAVLLLGMMISAYKWRVLAQFKDFDFPLVRYFQFYLTGTFLNNFFPSFIGGDTYRAYQLGKSERKYVSATATVVMDRVTGLLGAMILSVVFAIVNWRAVWQHQILLLIVAVAVAVLIGTLGVGVIVRFSFWKKLAEHTPKKVLEVIKDFVEYQGSAALKKSIFFSVIYGLVGLGLVNWVLFSALGIQIGIINYLTVIFLVSIVSSIPVSVNNIGIKEWAYVTFFGFFGVSASAVVTIAIISRVLQMLVSFVALPMYLKNKNDAR
ncbi:MAG: flippase-like domain-containing protein [Candidatus Moranbacteria bacterium]|nr:flippase-like domain-containing protein [Candidatus Moranbacteria bacterium]